jgi:hypothetical protein
MFYEAYENSKNMLGLSHVYKTPTLDGGPGNMCRAWQFS